MPSLGRIAYLLWFKPTSTIGRLATPAGLRDATVARWAAQEMAARAAQLQAPCDPEGFPIHFLTGRGFWHLSTFAAYSLLRASETPLHLVFEDDGSMDDATAERLRAAFPGCRIHGRAEQDAVLERILPTTEFPTLRRDLGRFLLLRKITGPHLGARGRRVFVDSDVLFFRRPFGLETWIRDGGAALIHMTDVDDQYGASRTELERIAGHAVPPRVNTGLYGAASEAIDWRRLEAWARAYIAQIGHTHFLEQSLIAMLAGETPSAGLPAADYIVAPSTAETKRPVAVAHHYAGPSRHLLYRQGWRHLVARGT